MKRMNKKGAEMAIGTLVVIVLLLIVLVSVAYMWITQSGVFTSTTGAVQGSPVESVVLGCNVACETARKSDYCTKLRSVEFGEGDSGNREWTCFELAENRGDSLGLETCRNIVCGEIVDNCLDLQVSECADNNKCNVEVISERDFTEKGNDKVKYESVENMEGKISAGQRNQLKAKKEICAKTVSK